MTNSVHYHTIGANRQKPRLWMEGEKLRRAGFVRGARYTTEFRDNTLVLTLDESGTHIVSGRTKNNIDLPIIDINPARDDQPFTAGTRVRVLFKKGSIAIALHHEDLARKSRETAFLGNLAAGTLREASMFTGGGVSTHAIHTALRDHGAPANLCWVVDADESYLDVAARNTHAITDNTVMLVGRAEEIEPAFFTNVDILSFSMPCSSFSRAGKAKHQQDPEEHEGAAALFGTLSAIRATNAAVLISENVVEAKDAPVYVLLKTELKRLGYVIFERVMDSRDTGSVENRRRWWFVALSEGIAAGFDFSLIHPAALEDKPCIADLLDSDVPEDDWFFADGLNAKAIRDAENGKSFKRQLLSGAETACGTIGRFYTKRRSTEPFLVRADGKERLFSPNEHARMKSAPPHLVANTGKTRAHEILGQSVDWRQAYLVMMNVLRHFGKTPTFA